jgi:branched-chain amino acid transport system substrate-binding protein
VSGGGRQQVSALVLGLGRVGGQEMTLVYRFVVGLCCFCAVSFAADAARSQNTVKIGLIMPYSGQMTDAVAQLDDGIKLYMKQHGDEVAGKKIELIRRDTGGIAPDIAKRLAQELLVRDKVDILGGLVFTPDALAVADVSAQAKVFTVAMLAAVSNLTTKSPYLVRASYNTPALNHTLGTWAAQHGAKRIYTIASDYGPGWEAESSFIAGATAAGSQIIGSVRVPVANPDFAPYIQRAKDAGPEAIYIWIPGGAQPAAIAKTLAEKGINPQNTMVVGQDVLVGEDALKSMGDTAVGIITAAQYDYNLSSERNSDFVKEYHAAFGRNPDIFSIGGYDGMHVIYEALKKTGGNTDGAALTAAAKGMSWDSPRGPVSIDPATRDIVLTVYIQKVEKTAAGLRNVVIDKFERVKDPEK